MQVWIRLLLALLKISNNLLEVESEILNELDLHFRRYWLLSHATPEAKRESRSFRLTSVRLLALFSLGRSPGHFVI